MRLQDEETVGNGLRAVPGAASRFVAALGTPRRAFPTASFYGGETISPRRFITAV